jgi:transposase-like protein
VPKPSSILDPQVPPSESERKQRDLAVSGASVESAPPKKRRRFTASEKLRLLKAAEAALASGERGALEALLRKEGIYNSHLTSWRQQLGARGAVGLTPQKRGRKPHLDDKDRQLLAMTREVAALKRKLQIANGLIALQKKAHEILGIALPEFDEESS